MPHIHIKYQEQETEFAISDEILIGGNLSENISRLVIAWIEIHKDELIADLELAINGQLMSVR